MTGHSTNAIRVIIALTALALLVGTASFCGAADWPSWRYDAQNRAVSPETLAAELHLQWVRQLPEPKRGWQFQFDDADKLAFDVSYEPVVAGKTMFVASMVTDSITAYDTETGQERWRFYANGPFRFAPSAWEGKLYAGCDDGHLYCLDADSGQLLWSFRQAPQQRWMLGNERLIDTWPVRGAPAVVDGTVYFAQGVWPFMGVFVYALDADSGKIVWANTGTGTMYNLHQHGGAYAFGGVAPQGYLAVTDDKVIVPGGRTPPAVFDRSTGEMLYFRQANEFVGKGAGGYRVWCQGDWFFNHGLPVQDQSNYMYALEDGAQFTTLSAQVVSDQHLLGIEGSELVAYASEPTETDAEIENRLARGNMAKRYSLVRLWRTETEVPLVQVHAQAGNRVYASGPEGLVAAVDLPQANGKPQVSWQGQVEGDVWRMLVADGKLFVVTEQGAVYAFGPGSGDTVVHAWEPTGPATADDGWDQRARGIIEQAGADEGYAMLWGLGSGRLMEELLRHSKLHIVAVDPDAARVEQARRRLTEAGLYGRRAAVLHGDPTKMSFAPYMASLVASEDLQAAGLAQGPEFVRQLFHVLRPYGGAAWLPLQQPDQRRLAQWVQQAGLEKARLDTGAQNVTLTREGALPGAGSWTHQYSDPQNTNYSPDQLARAPLGVLWYGGANNHNVLPRHNQGPTPQIVEGRLIIMGPDTVTARDVYTGREIWVHRWDGVGHHFTSLEHEEQWQTGRMVYFPNHPGANVTGSPYVSVPDGVYVIHGHGNVCRRLDPATGQIRAEFALPDDQQWGHLMVYDDLLIAAAGPQVFEDKPFGRDESWDGISSERLVVMDRHSGEVLWTRQAEYGFRHNAIVAGGGKVFAIDNLSETPLDILRRRGMQWTVSPLVIALDARTGQQIWVHNSDTFGTWLSYSKEHDILMQGGRRAGRRPLPDEPQDRMIAHRGADGSVLWARNERCVGHIGLRGDTIIGVQGRNAISLLTGSDITRTNPVTGEQTPWRYVRRYGCGSQLLSEHLLTFRSGAAGFYDLERDGGTGNFGGFRAGCTNNLVAADGVLNAPDYTRSCTCSYQLQTSLALVHMPEMEMWTYVPYSLGGKPVQRLGVNLGAPGHRMSEEGTLWVDYPEAVDRGATGSALDAPISLSGQDVNWYLEHSWQFDGAEGHDWVAASGLEGSATLRIGLAGKAAEAAESSYTVRLHFAEPGQARPGERKLNLWVQGRQVLREFDPVAEAGAARRAVVVKVAGVKATDDVRIGLSSSAGSKLPPVLSGVELLAEDGRIASADAIDWASAPGSLVERTVVGLHNTVTGWYLAVAALL